MSTDRNENVRLVTLQDDAVQISVEGQSRYSFPADFDIEIGIDILSGTHTDTAQAGGATSITLAADEDVGESSVEGHYILITAGTGQNGFKQCIDYNTTTKVATVDEAWDTNPDVTSTYLIVDDSLELDPDNVMDTGNLGGTSFGKGKPSEYMKVNEGASEYFYFNVPCDAIYGIHLRYYVNPNRVDLTGALMTKLYNNWQNILTVGTAREVAADEDDDKYAVFDAQFNKALDQLKAREIPFGGEFAGFEVG